MLGLALNPGLLDTPARSKVYCPPVEIYFTDRILRQGSLHVKIYFACEEKYFVLQSVGNAGTIAARDLSMTKAHVQALSEYVARVMEEKDLTPAEVGRLSGGKITSAYVRSLAGGSSSNPSISKLKSLARGLDVDEDTLFRIARGLNPTDKEKTDEDRSRYFRVMKLISASMKNPLLVKLLLEVGKLPVESQDEALKLLTFLNRKKRVSKRRSQAG